ncbi:hypothetical protein ZEAMMB73_Zm00001d017776 [Zea mays]|uniref:Uncharacterized protein n=1 Tax=Zea mays TaxID=4577 RepID=A0A1D6HHK7_MAIZE|nr:hypothetical protein ZEAMMB73_Zm00001d017776 [Zea mays]
MQQLQPKQMHWVRADSSDFGGDRPAPRSHQRHDASCEEDDLYGYGGIVNEWGTIGLLLLEAAAERIVGDGALETWGVADKATRVKLCMLGVPVGVQREGDHTRRAAPRGTCSRSASSIATSIVLSWLPSPFRYLTSHATMKGLPGAQG